MAHLWEWWSREKGRRGMEWCLSEGSKFLSDWLSKVWSIEKVDFDINYVQSKDKKKERLASQRSIILLESKCLCSPLPELWRPVFIQVSGLIQNTDLNQLWPSVPVLLADLCLKLQRHWRGSLGLQAPDIPGPLPANGVFHRGLSSQK